MNKNKLIEAMEAERQKQQGSQSNNISVKTPEIKKNNTTPHLALCHNDNPPANGRTQTLMLKTKSISPDATVLNKQVEITKQGIMDCNFELFCKGMQDPVVLLELFQIMMSQKHSLIDKIITKGTK